MAKDKSLLAFRERIGFFYNKAQDQLAYSINTTDANNDVLLSDSHGRNYTAGISKQEFANANLEWHSFAIDGFGYLLGSALYDIYHGNNIGKNLAILYVCLTILSPNFVSTAHTRPSRADNEEDTHNNNNISLPHDHDQLNSHNFSGISNKAINAMPNSNLEADSFRITYSWQSDQKYLMLTDEYAQRQTIATAEQLRVYLLHLLEEPQPVSSKVEIKEKLATINHSIDERITTILSRRIEGGSQNSKSALIQLIKSAREMPLARKDIDFVLDNPHFTIHIHQNIKRFTEGLSRDAFYLLNSLKNPYEARGALLWQEQKNQDITLLIHEIHHMALNYAHIALSGEGENAVPYYPVNTEKIEKFKNILKVGDEKFQRFEDFLKRESKLTRAEKKELKKYKLAAETFNIPGGIPVRISAHQAEILKIGKTYNLDHIFGMPFGNVEILEIKKETFATYLATISPKNKDKATVAHSKRIEMELTMYREQEYWLEKDAYIRQYFSAEIIETFYPGLIAEAENLLTLATQKIEQEKDMNYSVAGNIDDANYKIFNIKI